MKVMGYDIVVDVDGTESIIQLDDTYPAISDWQTATEFALLLARHEHPEAVNIEFVECGEYRMEEYDHIPYMHEAPFILQ